MMERGKTMKEKSVKINRNSSLNTDISEEAYKLGETNDGNTVEKKTVEETKNKFDVILEDIDGYESNRNYRNHVHTIKKFKIMKTTTF